MKLRKLLTGICACTMAAALLAGCGANTASDKTDSQNTEQKAPIRIATKPMTEQYILGQMLKLIIEDATDYTTEVTEGIAGGTNNIQPAMEKGEFDLYPEYTSSGYVMVLKHEATGVSDDEIWETLGKEYDENFDFSWVSHYGFNNTYAVAVDAKVAEEYQLKTTSDLAKVADKLVFGGNPDYQEREDGFPLLCETYDLKFKEVKDIDIALKYDAIEKGDIQVTNGFTTDAQIGSGKVVVLEDDKHLQVNYLCSTVVRNEALENYPGLEDALMKMDGLISDQEMAQLNHQVEVEGKEAAEVAKEFLTSKNILK